MVIQILLIMSTPLTSQAFIFDLDLKLDSALKKGGALSRNTGAYLFDSFRTEVLTPAFASVIDELKANHKNDVVTNVLIFVICVAMGSSIILLWIKMKGVDKTVKGAQERGQP